MTKRSDASQPLAEQPLPRLTTTREKAEELIGRQIEKGQGLILGDYSLSPEAEYKRLLHEYYSWNDFNRDLLKKLFDSPAVSTEYYLHVGSVVLGAHSLETKVRFHNNDVEEKLRRLRSVVEKLPLYDEPVNLHGSPRASTAENRAPSDMSAVFVVHGQDETAKQTVARFLEHLDLKPVILHEQSNLGKTIIEKLERDANSVGFAVVLLTPDDIGWSKEGVMYLRARQNVIFELGYFIGVLGREKVCVLCIEGVEPPSDYSGVVYVPLDATGGWKLTLVRELRAAGLDVNMSKVL
ncbi:MAG: nucleotide-binding protein [Dehalococcoidia bacterium]|nr:nucleotide-binding protein [Dehalococcoidia bacterium]